jgi:hypothetical protein
VKLFTTPKDSKRSWPEHYMYLVATSEVTGNSEYMVMTNIVCGVVKRGQRRPIRKLSLWC